eukprot:c23374_g1_i1 orf=147-1778(-)
MDLNDPCLQTDGSCLVRLHVGGLGPSVISSDLLQTFSSFAKVSSVDVVRTKGRNFAYVTLQAAPQDIKRLFSLYNGCLWKGGRLKLEKARELYLDKLHREWAERDCLQDMETPKLDCITSTRSITKANDSIGFKMYFPKLRKVKNIPEKGLGKHKRSFQRVDPVPCSVLQICNCCDEHCMATRKEPPDPKSATIRTSMSESRTGCEPGHKGSGNKGIKGFERKTGVDRKSGDGRGRNTVPDVDELYLNIGGTLLSEKDDAEGITDLDEPVLNITGSNESYLGQPMNFVKEEAHAVIKQQVQASKKEAHEGAEGAGYAQRKQLKLDPDNIASKENKLSEAENIVDLILQRGETNESKFFQNPDGKSWIQKASWKSLVGETGRMSFSLGNMLDQNHTISPSSGSNLKSASEKLGQPSGFEKRSNKLSSSTEDPFVDGPNISINSQSNFHQHRESLAQDSGEGIFQTSKCSKPCSVRSNDLKETVQEEHSPSSKMGIGDDGYCTFMKSGESEQDWLESKQAAKGIIKRSRKDALRSVEGLYKKQKH